MLYVIRLKLPRAMRGQEMTPLVLLPIIFAPRFACLINQE
jgi:hypothetical protein